MNKVVAAQTILLVVERSSLAIENIGKELQKQGYAIEIGVNPTRQTVRKAWMVIYVSSTADSYARAVFNSFIDSIRNNKHIVILRTENVPVPNCMANEAVIDGFTLQPEQIFEEIQVAIRLAQMRLPTAVHIRTQALEALRRPVNVTYILPEERAEGNDQAQNTTSGIPRHIVEFSAEQIRVLEALAILGQPAAQVEIEYLLAPFMDTSMVGEALSDLAAKGFVKYSEATDHYTLFPADHSYVLKRIPSGKTGADEGVIKGVYNGLWFIIALFSERLAKDGAGFFTKTPSKRVMISSKYTRQELTERAANYFTQQSPSSTGQILTDTGIKLQLRKLDYELAAQQFDRAALLLINIRIQMIQAGYAIQLVNYYEQLIGKIRNPYTGHIMVGSLALACVATQQFDKAIHYSEQAIRLAEGNHDYGPQIKYLLLYGELNLMTGMIDTGVKSAKKALDVTREQPHMRLERAECLGTLGLACFMTGELKRAIAYFEDARRMSREYRLRQSERVLVNNLAGCYIALGHSDTALSYIKDALVISRDTQNKEGEYNTLVNNGLAHLQADRIDLALSIWIDALAIAKKTRLPYIGSHAGCNLAAAQALLDKPDQALQTIIVARAINAPDNNHVAAAFHGAILARLNQPYAAMDALRDALDISSALLQITPALFTILYVQAFIKAAMALLIDDSMDAALADLADARKICDAPGVRKETRLFLGILTPIDFDSRLKPVLQALE